MITCKLQGGIGNVLFQVATTYALAKQHGVDFYFDFDAKPSSTTQHFKSFKVYRTNLLKALPHKKRYAHRNRYKEPFFHYKKIPFQDDLILQGLFQSYKYFNDQRDAIIKLLRDSNDSTATLSTQYVQILDRPATSLHVRRGDYLKLSHIHPVQSLDYYNRALKVLQPKGPILVFSDDIEWCKQSFNGGDYIFVENQPDYLDLYLMSLCPYNIICNSTFSWWAAYLNTNRDKKAIAPKQWFGKQVKHRTEDLYLPSWQLL